VMPLSLHGAVALGASRRRACFCPGAQPDSAREQWSGRSPRPASPRCASTPSC
jgi:hypothetical protein